MIGGATRGAGGRALGAHLADAKAQNELTREGASRGLVSTGIRDQVRELGEVASHARSARPLYHVHADPAGAWSEGQWDRYWRAFEEEFGLSKQPFAEAVHIKQGREHRHRVYSLAKPDGTVIPMRHDFARREKLHRLAELETGERLTAGRHNKAVLAALEAEGKHDAAAALREAGLDRRDRPAAVTPEQRAQAERTMTDPNAVGVLVLTAWRASDGGGAFRAALEERGLRLAQGDRVPVVIDAEGGAHPLARILGRESKAADGERIRAADVADRLSDLDLPRHAPDAGRRPRAAPADQPEAPQPTAEDRADAVPADDVPAAEEAAPSAAEPTQEEQAAPVGLNVDTAAPAPEPVEAAANVDNDARNEIAEPVAEAPAAPAPSAGGSKGGGGAAPSAGGGSEAPDSDTIAPLDPSKPDDVARFLRDFARVMQRRAAKAAANEKKGGGAHGGQQDTKWIEEWLADLRRTAEQAQRDGRALSARDAYEQARASRAARAEGQAVDARPAARGARRDGVRPDDLARARPQGPDRHGVRGAAGGRDDGRPARAAGAGGPARGEGGQPARPDPAAPRADRRSADPHGAAHGRTRIRTRRALRGLAAAASLRADRLARLTAALAAAPTPATLAREAIQADRVRARAVLDTEPHRDPRSRTTDGTRSELRDQVIERQREVEARAAQATQRADEARARLRLRDRILPTAAAREARQLAEQVERLRLDSELGHEATGQELRAADERAPHVAQARRREHEAWERRPDVLDARRREEADRLIENRLRRGDCSLLARVASGDLKGAQRQALEEERRRQDEIRRQREEQLRREHEERMRGYTPSRAPAPDGRLAPGPQR